MQVKQACEYKCDKCGDVFPRDKFGMPVYRKLLFGKRKTELCIPCYVNALQHDITEALLKFSEVCHVH